MLNRLVVVVFFITTIILPFQGCYVDDVDESVEASTRNDSEIQEYIQANGVNATGTGSGLFYEITENTNGQTVSDGDSIRVHYVVRLLSGRVVDSTSRFRNKPLEAIINTNQLFPGLEEGIEQMQEGETATLLIPSYLALGSNGTFDIPPYSVLIYEVTLDEVKSEEEQINEYVANNNLEVTSINDNRLRYIRVSEGSAGTAPTDGATARVAYEGKLLNGTVFDSNSDSTFTFEVGQNSVIQGWEQGIKLMNQGEKAILIIPSEIAYGQTGQTEGGIPPYAPLAFEMTYVKTEAQALKEYIASNISIATITTESGLIHAISDNGSGTQVTDQATVTVSYKAYFIDYDDTLVEFASSTAGTFNLASDDRDNGLADGLKQGLLLLQQGGKATFMMPSELAFGDAGQGNVKGRVPVIYEVEITNVQ